MLDPTRPITGLSARCWENDEFEQSRGRAQEAYDRLAAEMAEDRTGERTLQKLAEAKIGRKVKFPKLADLAD